MKLKLSIFGLIISFSLWLMVFVFAPAVKADAVTDNALNFLKSKQDAEGRITTGFSAPSQWSAIAFAISNIEVSTVKAFDKSLYDFLLSDAPTNNAATDWESRILAIVATGGNPTNFNGTNYVSSLENFHNNGQLGDECASATPEIKKYNTNDDIYGLLALVASGNASNMQIKQDVLNFLISQQDAVNGGFSWTAPGCDWYEASADMTGVAIQALVAAKNNGLSHTDLDNAIEKAKQYLLNSQNSDGGFGYYGSSDPDSTNQVLQAFNLLGMKDSTQAVNARNYILALQSATDGGFMAYDWGTGTFVSNATTTAQSIISLSGNGLIIKIFDPSAGQTPTVTPTPTSAPSSSNSSPTSTPTPTIIPTVTPTPVVFASNFENEPTNTSEEEISIDPTSAPEQEVLGAQAESKNNYTFAWLFAGLGLFLIFIYIVKTFIIKKI